MTSFSFKDTLKDGFFQGGKKDKTLFAIFWSDCVTGDPVSHKSATIEQDHSCFFVGR